MKKMALFGILVAVVAGLMMPIGHASSHREAPLISQDPLADNTDLYAFVTPNDPTTVTLIANFIPLEAPYGGPNFFKFDDTVLYEIMVDNDGDGVEDITYQFRFQTKVQNQATFLYNTGPIHSLDDPNFNVRQTYTVTRVTGSRRDSDGDVLAADLSTPPVNVGPKSTPDYDTLAAAAVHTLPGGGKVFAGQRDDPFFVDLSAVFDLLNIRSLPGDQGGGVDNLAEFNVHTIALQVPISDLTRTHSAPSQAGDAAAVIGVWSAASRREVSVRRPGTQSDHGDWVQVSRLGQPLVNEVVIPRGRKDAFNASQPRFDGMFLNFVTQPEVPTLLHALFGLTVPSGPRNDLVTIFLTGIPGLNQPPNVKPSEMLRLNVAIPPTATPNRLGVLGGDVAGFPNGRRLTDDVVDIAFRAMAGATPLTPAFNSGVNARLGDGVDGNDVPFMDVFPFVASPHPGFEK